MNEITILLAEGDPDLLNGVYREICVELGIGAVISIYKMYKGQQINFPMRLFNPARIQKQIRQEYDGTNIKSLAKKYDYSEKTVRRIIRMKPDI